MGNVMPATWDAVVSHFLSMDWHDRLSYNWMTAPDNSIWNVNDETYINGILLTLDYDLMMGYLIEVVERTSKVVSYGIIVTWPHQLGRNHDSMMYEGYVGTFYDRQFDSEDACLWAIPRMHGLLER